ncbi:MAG: peptide deformylase [Candidatus Daviesbacteria bacterium]
MKVEFNSIDDPILREVMPFIDESELKSKQIKREIEIMLELFYQSTAIISSTQDWSKIAGLAANQVGIYKRIAIIDLAPYRKNPPGILVLINPEIIRYSDSLIGRYEGCASLPNIWGYIKRPASITLRALDPSGNEMKIKAYNRNATVIQHEIDHLDGKLFIDRLENPTQAHYVTPEDLVTYRRLGKNWNKFIDVSNLVR